ncbi:MAG TPA: ABC transporter permease [Saccharofermentans sp.]|nr:ABC transporter permease [Saccharofermentans sp.]
MQLRFLDSIKSIVEKGSNERKRSFFKFILSVPFWVLVASLVIGTFSVVNIFSILGARKDKSMNEYWQQGTDVRYRHMAVYASGSRSFGLFSPLTYEEAGGSLCVSDITTIRTALQNVSDSSNTSGKGNGLKDGKPQGWEDCYSSILSANVIYSSDVNEDGIKTDLSSDTSVIAVSGNFRAFHPYEYLSGGFLPEDEVDKNQIVINDVLAWTLFKSYDIVGSRITIFNEEFVIVGVVSQSTGKIDELVGNEDPQVFMYFSKLIDVYAGGFFGTSEGMSSSDLAIGCYEAMLPEEVSGVANSDMIAAIPSYSVENNNMYVISCTGRYNLKNIWNQMIPFGAMEEKYANIDFPSWEKASQLTLQYLFYDCVAILMALVLMISAIVSIILRYHARKAIPALDTLVTEEIDESEENKKDF